MFGEKRPERMSRFPCMITSLCAAVMICAILVNTQTHTQVWPAVLLAHPAELKPVSHISRQIVIECEKWVRWVGWPVRKCHHRSVGLPTASVSATWFAFDWRSINHWLAKQMRMKASDLSDSRSVCDRHDSKRSPTQKTWHAIAVAVFPIVRRKAESMASVCGRTRSNTDRWSGGDLELLLPAGGCWVRDAGRAVPLVRPSWAFPVCPV